ncbi:hypothetical protein VCHENC01_4368 [Vibrio harveyi]|nr:hypothetical protein VCHENC01_4368 [Vibrio harveyi]
MLLFAVRILFNSASANTLLPFLASALQVRCAPAQELTRL